MSHMNPPSNVISLPSVATDTSVRAGRSKSGEPSAGGRVVQGQFGNRARGTRATGERGDSSLARPPKVLVVDHDHARCSELGELFEDIGYDTYEAGDSAQAEAWWSHLRDIDVLLLDLNLPDRSAFALLALLMSATDDRLRPAVVVMARRDQRALALEAMRAGAFDWHQTPIDVALLSHAVARASEHVRLRRVDRLFQHLMNHSI